MKKRLSTLLALSILILFAFFFAERLFMPGFQFYGEEKSFLNFDFVNFRYQTMWEGTHNYGGVTAGIFNILPSGVLWQFFSLFNLTPIQMQFFFFALVIAATLVFSYLLFYKLTSNQILSLLFSVAFITTYNYYATFSTTPKLFHFLIIPASVWFWESYIQSKKISYLIGFMLFTIFTIGIAVNPPQMLGAYSFVFFYALCITRKKASIAEYINFFSIPTSTIIFVVFVHALTVYYAGQIFPRDILSTGWSATGSAMHEIVRFFGAWWDYGTYQGLAYNHLIYYYHSTLGVIITYIPFTLVLILLYVHRKKPDKTLPLLALLLICITLAKGGTVPFQQMFNYLFSMPFFKIFREPWAKFIPNVILATYIALAILIFDQKHRVKYIFVVLLTIVCAFQIMPLIKGRVNDHRNIKWKMFDVKIPDYWITFSKWSKTNLKDSRTLVLPLSTNPQEQPVVHSWYPYRFNGKPEEFFAYTSLVADIYPDKEHELVVKHITDTISPQTMSLASIDYVLYKNDVFKPSKKIIDLPAVADALDLTSGVVFGDGKLVVYPVKEQYRSPKIRAVTNIFSAKNQCDKNLINDIVSKNSAYVSKMPLDVTKLYAPKNITYTKLSHTTYQIQINENIPADSTIGLFFNDGFNRGWNLYSSLIPYPQKITQNIQHVKANCLSNLWLINSNDLSGNKTIYIHFEPQTHFISLSGIYGLCLALIVLFHIKRKKNHVL